MRMHLFSGSATDPLAAFRHWICRLGFPGSGLGHVPQRQDPLYGPAGEEEQGEDERKHDGQNPDVAEEDPQVFAQPSGEEYWRNTF